MGSQIYQKLNCVSNILFLMNPNSPLIIDAPSPVKFSKTDFLTVAQIFVIERL